MYQRYVIRERSPANTINMKAAYPAIGSVVESTTSKDHEIHVQHSFASHLSAMMVKTLSPPCFFAAVLYAYYTKWRRIKMISCAVAIQKQSENMLLQIYSHYNQLVKVTATQLFRSTKGHCTFLQSLCFNSGSSRQARSDDHLADDVFLLAPWKKCRYLT